MLGAPGKCKSSSLLRFLFFSKTCHNKRAFFIGHFMLTHSFHIPFSQSLIPLSTGRLLVMQWSPITGLPKRLRSKKLLEAPGLTTSNKDTTRSKGHRYERSKDATRNKCHACVHRWCKQSQRIGLHISMQPRHCGRASCENRWLHPPHRLYVPGWVLLLSLALLWNTILCGRCKALTFWSKDSM